MKCLSEAHSLPSMPPSRFDIDKMTPGYQGVRIFGSTDLNVRDTASINILVTLVRSESQSLFFNQLHLNTEAPRLHHQASTAHSAEKVPFLRRADSDYKRSVRLCVRGEIAVRSFVPPRRTPLLKGPCVLQRGLHAACNFEWGDREGFDVPFLCRVNMFGLSTWLLWIGL